jgi:hypothetical protein
MPPGFRRIAGVERACSLHLYKRLLLGIHLMEAIVEFGNVVTGLQHLPEREKIIIAALMNAHGTQNVDTAKLERLIAQTIIAAARENQRGAEPKIPALNAAFQDAAIVSRIH